MAGYIIKEAADKRLTVRDFHRTEFELQLIAIRSWKNSINLALN